NLSNAKALIYFSSVFSLFITADMGTSEAVLIYAVVVLESFFWFSFVALILGLPKPKAFYRKSGRWIDGICGAIFGVFGTALIWTAVKESDL
ncbi:LysE family transporter, partial [Parasutterella excrementihominis]